MEYSEQPQLYRTQRKTFSQIGLSCFVILAVTVILQIAAKYFIYYFAPGWANQIWYPWVLTIIPMYAVGVPIGVALLRRIPAYRPFPKKLRFGDLLIFLIMCFPIMFLGNLVGSRLDAALHALLGTETQDPLYSYIFGSSIWLTALFTVIMAPVIEELIFRKLLIDRLRPYGEGVCVLISAVMFGLFHGNLMQFFYAFGVGAVFAFIYIKTGRVQYTIFLHMTINFFGAVLAPLLLKSINLSALTQAMTAGSQAVWGYLSGHLPGLMAFGLYITVYFSLVIAGFVLLITRRRAFNLEQGPMQIQRGSVFRTLFVNWGMGLFVAGALAMFAVSLL